MPEIPVNPMDLPTEAEPFDDAITYRGTIEKIGSDIDKNGDTYLNIEVSVTEPEELAGRKIFDPYIGLPRAVEPGMDAKARRRALESGVKLGRLCRSANFKPTGSKWDTDELIGAEIKFMIRNEEYQGRVRPKINEYVF